MSKEQMYFMIKLSPRYEGFLEEKKMDWRDLGGVLRNHAARHTKNSVKVLYLKPEMLDKQDPLGKNGYIGWSETEASWSALAKQLEQHPFGYGKKQMVISCSPPHLKDDFPFKAIGLTLDDTNEHKRH